MSETLSNLYRRGGFLSIIGDMGDDMKEFQRDVNEAFREGGGEQAVRGEIESNEKRLGDIRASLRAIDRFMGGGLADAMPLREAVGFLDVKLELDKRGYDLRRISREELERARDFLAGIIGKEYPAKTELGTLVEKLKEEEKEILA